MAPRESGRLSLVSWRGAVKDEPRTDKGNDLGAAKCYVTTVHGRSRDKVPNYYAHENEPYSPSRQLSRGRERNTTWAQEQTPSNLFTSAFGWRARPGEIVELRRTYKWKQYYIIAREKKKRWILPFFCRDIPPLSLRGYPERVVHDSLYSIADSNIRRLPRLFQRLIDISSCIWINQKWLAYRTKLSGCLLKSCKNLPGIFVKNSRWEEYFKEFLVQFFQISFYCMCF